MMRPKRFRIMPRTTSLERTKAPVRLVASTLCQSSRLIRRSRLSAVMPALLTRTSMPARSGGSDLSRSPIEAGCATSSTRAWALPPAASIRATRAASFSSLRAAAITLAPSSARRRAIASPIPCEAPVTRAILPSSRCMLGLLALLLGRLGRGPGSGRGEHLVELRRLAERRDEQALDDAPGEAREHRARADLEERSHPRALDHEEHRLDPAHGAVDLADQRIACRLPGDDRRGIDVADHRHSRIPEFYLLEDPGHPLARGLHQRRMERRRDGEERRLPRAALLGERDGAVDRRPVAGEHGLARAVQVGDGADLLGMLSDRLGGESLARLAVEADDRG